MEKKTRNGNRYCPICKHKLCKNGRSKLKTQRWYCKKCHKYINLVKPRINKKHLAL